MGGRRGGEGGEAGGGEGTNLERGAEDQQPRLVNLHATLRDGSDNGSVFVEELAKHDPRGVGNAHEHELEGTGSDSDRTHAVDERGSGVLFAGKRGERTSGEYVRDRDDPG